MSVQTKNVEILIYPDGRMNTKNAAAYTGLSEKTLATLRCHGKGPKFVKRGRIFYYRDDLDEWMRAGRVSSTAQTASKMQAQETRHE
jgi:hypothetical protein